MVNQDVSARNLEAELNHRRAARRNHGGLNVSEGGRGQRSLLVYSIEDLADHMEGGGKVGPADAEEDTHRFANLGLERFLLGQATDCAIEDQVFRVFVEQCRLI